MRCPDLTELRLLDDEAIARWVTELSDAVADIEKVLEQCRLEDPGSPTERQRKAAYARAKMVQGIRNCRNIQAERRAKRDDWRALMEDFYDAVKAYLDNDGEDEDSDAECWDRLVDAYNAIPVPHRHRQQEGAA